MVSVQNGTDVGPSAGAAGEFGAEDDTIPSATSPVTPCTELFGRARVSGIHFPNSADIGA